MHNLKRAFILAILLTSMNAAAQQRGAAVRLRFAFGALTGTGAAQKLTSITEDTALRTGDRIKMMVEMQQAGFAYVIHRDPKDQIEVLFPADLKQSPQVSRKYYIPAADWLEFDAITGSETFYLLASPQRLTTLESLLERHAGTTEIVAEIRRLRTQNSNAVVQADRPVVIGGNVRSIDQARGANLPDVSTIATEINANGFYARTFTIDHR